MARIQNKNLPWSVLVLPSGQRVKTDGDGVIENISDADANWLAGTPHWHAPESIGSVTLERPPEPVVLTTRPGMEPALAAMATAPQRLEPLPEPANVPEEPGATEPAAPEPAAAEGEEPGPDLEALNKTDLIEIAVKYGVKINPRDSKDSIKALLSKALYGE